MMEGDSANLAIEPPDSKYLNGFLDNVGAIQDHLAGNDGTPLSPSFLPPNAVWTPREKNAFFHALSIYSRFRPDLISHVIKTKSVTDVCNYLSVLQLAASQQDTSVSDSQWRQNFPIAMEVSPEWVAIEEETSFDLIAREQDWQCELISERRRTGLKLLKKAYKTESHEVEPSRYKAELKQEIANANLRDRRKDFCDSLGSSELTAIGIILHKSADPSGSSQIIQVPSALHPLAPQDSPGPTAGPGTLQAHQPSATKVTETRNPPDLAQQRPSSNGEPFHPCSPKQDSTASLAGLSPASRRRHQKRLYMRRKRASTSGVAAINDSLKRLKPGRKKVKRSLSPEDEALRALEVPTSEEKEDVISVSEADGPSTTPKRYPRAKQVAIDKLRDLGLGADDLRGFGVDVINPEGVAKMLGLWDKLSGDTSDHGSRISIETIQLLDAHVVWFVKNMIYRAITRREQECALKSETKVWKLSGKPVLTREHVERAVSMANAREPNKARFFEAIVADVGVNVGTEETEGDSTVTLLPLHRDIYAPLVWIPELGDDSEMTDNTDDEEVDNELMEEAVLDELDMGIEMEHESGLWDKAQRFRTSNPKIEASITKRRQRTTNKSSEFIEDSD